MQKEDRKNRTSKLRKIELIAWFSILLVFVCLIAGLIIRHNNSFETHDIYFPDVYGLIVGSPVHIMGVPVGYVTKTKIIKDDTILVRFKVTDKSVHLPKNTLATVEMYGLGGSKSLELYPPDSNKLVNQELLVSGNDYFLVERPKRLRDCWTLLYQMYKTLMNIIYAVSNFGAEINEINISPEANNFNDSVQFLNYSNNWIDNSSKNMENFRQVLEHFER